MTGHKEDEAPVAGRAGSGSAVALQELEQVLQASLEATADGILAVDNRGKIILSNEKFAEMWRIPKEMIRAKDDLPIREFVMDQLLDPQAYMDKIRSLYGGRESDTDVLRFKDGRILERFSAPLVISGVVAGRVWSFRDVSAYHDTQRRLAQSEEKYRELVENANSIILGWDTNGIITFINQYGRQLFGFEEEELVGRAVIGTIVADKESTGRDLVAMIDGIRGRPDEFVSNENENTTKDGQSIWVSWSNRPIYNEVGKLVGILSIGNDITERKKLEQQLFQAQKMEAVGQLAGGIAHDFNNMLMVINGYCQLLLDELQDDAAMRRNVEQIKATSARAAALTRQLLAFGRRQVVQPRIIDLNELLHNMQEMVKKLIGEAVELDIHSRQTSLNIYADPIQVEQVILNLAANARDAMPGGGRLSIETEKVELESPSDGELHMVSPGSYVLCAVRDAGTGMAEETLEHIFEPFFTTKESSKGTGLGLSTVYGIVKQNEGYIFVHSEPGKGSTFSVYFPWVSDEELLKGEECRASAEKLKGTERILLVENEPKVRRYIKSVLQKHGYSVNSAGSAADALALWKTFEGRIDLLVTSDRLADLKGTELIEKIREMQPDVQALLIVDNTGQAPPAGLEVILRPLTSHALLRKMRKVLDA